MRVCPLSTVEHRIVIGAPLPFGVCDANRRRLMVRGQVIADRDQLQALLACGALVEADDVADAAPRPRRGALAPRPSRLPAEWDQATVFVRAALTSTASGLAAAIDGAADLLLDLIRRSPDVALSQVARQPEDGSEHYGVSHSIHAAIACHAIARYLGWDGAGQRRALQAALTMNLSMIDLQARLATQMSPLTTRQRQAIQQHPSHSTRMLREAGIADEDWLNAVATHHETADGSGYPTGTNEIAELAEMLRFADVYTALLSSRAHRPAVSARQAGRELYRMAADSPIAAALIKSFGIFPPGSLVKMASGECGVVTRNGDKAHHPRVAALTDAAGKPRPMPVMRDSADDEHAVVALLSPVTMPMRVSQDRIVGLISGG